MDTVDTTQVLKNNMNDTDILSSYIKCEINDCGNLTNQQLIDESNTMQITESFEKKSAKEAEARRNKINVCLDPDILHESELIEENIKVEPECNSFSNDEHGPTKMIEFVQINCVKLEETDEDHTPVDISDPIDEGKTKLLRDDCSMLVRSKLNEE